jgi:hypothetical protein
MNVELMNKVADAIEAHPEAYDQSTFCGTPCCYVGHAEIIVFGRDVYQKHVESMGSPGPHDFVASGIDLFGITRDQAEALIGFGDSWPEPFASKYTAAVAGRDAEGRASAGAARLRHFIATEGRE